MSTQKVNKKRLWNLCHLQWLRLRAERKKVRLFEAKRNFLCFEDGVVGMEYWSRCQQWTGRERGEREIWLSVKTAGAICCCVH